ncbi:unnamed protein product [Cunninghamella blakesleeana]
MIPKLAASWYRQSSSPFMGASNSWTSKNIYKTIFIISPPLSQQRSSLFHTIAKSYQLVQQQQQCSKITSCIKLKQQKTMAWPAGRRVYTSQIKNTSNNKQLTSTALPSKTQKSFTLESTANESIKQRNKTDWPLLSNC